MEAPDTTVRLGSEAANEALGFIQNHGIADVAYLDPSSTLAAVTRKDVSAVVPARRLVGPLETVLPSSVAAVGDQSSLFELLTFLEQSGFEHVELPKGGFAALRRKGKTVSKVYVVGDPKVWVTRSGKSSLGWYYLMALARAPEHNQPVPHNATEAYYSALISGQPLPEKKRGRTMFSFVDDVLGPRPPPEARARPRAKRRRLASPSLLATADPSPSSSSEQSSSEDSDSQPASVGSDAG
eukprot:375445-Alexandrium_andersonii.AAC.1